MSRGESEMKKNLILKVLAVLVLSQTLLTAATPVKAFSNFSKAEAGMIKMRELILAQYYNWSVSGEWTNEQLVAIYKAGWTLQKYIESTGVSDGRLWIRKNIGNVTFHHEMIINTLTHSHFALPTRDIFLLNENLLAPTGPRFIVHELAHFIDNNLGGELPASFFGGGPADEMVANLGGHPELCNIKFSCPKDYYQKVAGPAHWTEKAYANNSVADDFAETFAHAAFKPERVPAERLNWMSSFVRYEAY
jgi:hypothetical protein